MKLKCRVSFQTKTIHMIASNHPFSPVVTDLVMNMQAPISGLVLHPAYCLSTTTPLSLKSSFHVLFWGFQFALLDTTLWLPLLCPSSACCCRGHAWVKLTWHSAHAWCFVILSRFVIQKAWSWLIPTFSWGTPALSKREGKYFNKKVPSASTLHLAMPCWKWFSVRGKCPLWISRPLTGEATKKLSARTWFSFVLYWRWAPRWTAR